jgi:hypothetical protein
MSGPTTSDPPGLPKIDPRTGISPPTCPTDGNSGFPVFITGPEMTDTLLDSIKMQSNYKYSFAPRTTLPAKISDNGFLDEPAGSSFMVDGIQYDLVNVQLVPPNANNSAAYTYAGFKVGRPIAEYILQYKKRNASDIGESALIIMFPIYNVAKAEGTQVISRPVDDYLAVHLGLPQDVAGYPTPVVFFSGLPQAPRSISYTTCVETTNGLLRLKVILFLNSYCVSAVTAAGYAKYLSSLDTQAVPVRPRYRLGPSIRGGANTFGAADVKNGKLVASDESTEGYVRSGEIATTSGEFKQRMISSTDRPKDVAVKDAVHLGNRSTQQFKCIPLDKAKDVQGNFVVIDPVSGERTLKEELDDRDAVAKALGAQAKPAPVAESNKWKIVGITLIIIISLALVIWGMRVFYNWLDLNHHLDMFKSPEMVDVTPVNAVAKV